MNLPNRLTLIRVVLVPVYMLFMMWSFPFHYVIAGIVFAAACLTDYWDGRIARSRGLVTDFGKFLDPIADKMLTTSAFVVLLPLGMVNVWALMLILTREFAVSSVRMLAANGGEVVEANFFGKLKTVAQYIAILFSMAALQWNELSRWLTFLPRMLFSAPIFIGKVLIWISVIFTVISGARYIYDCRRFLR